MHDEAVCAALRVLGFAPRVLGYVEREAGAAAWLLARMEAKALEPSPVWCGDLCDLDARPLRGWVDVLVASPPCQPYSSAGKRRGNADERSFGDACPPGERPGRGSTRRDGTSSQTAGVVGPLPHTIRIIDECRPALVQFENVPEWVTGGHFREFGEELCRLGYDIAPPLFLAAADVGAPHERERVFIQCRLANQCSGGREKHAERNGPSILERFTASRRGNALRCDTELGDAASARPDSTRCWASFEQHCRESLSGAGGEAVAQRPRGGLGIGGQPSECDGQPDGGGEGLADAEGPRREGHEPAGDSRAGGCAGKLDSGMGHTECAESRPGEAGEQGGARIGRSGHTDAGDGFPMFPPGRTDYAAWAELVTRGLDPACMPAVERGFSALADGLAFSNSELLRLGGNGVVPLAAGVAFILLLQSER